MDNARDAMCAAGRDWMKVAAFMKCWLPQKKEDGESSEGDSGGNGGDAGSPDGDAAAAAEPNEKMIDEEDRQKICATFTAAKGQVHSFAYFI